MTDVVIQKKNEVYLTVECEPHIKYELSEYFTFEVPNAKFMPQYKKRLWDGTIKLFSPADGKIYCGLYDYLVEWLDSREYSYENKNNEYYGLPQEDNDLISVNGVVYFVKSLNIPFKVRDYQYYAIFQALKYNRRLLLSPTASGKSLMIYSITRFFANRGDRILIVVPTTSLVEQMCGDFDTYGWSSDENCHKIYAGKDKQTNKQVVVTTWQSIYKLPKNYFEQFDCVIGDEAHLFKAKSLINIKN